MKKTIKNISCDFLFFSRLLDLCLVRKSRGGNPIIILAYHSFAKKPFIRIENDCSVVHAIDDFHKEIRWLKKYFDVISLGDAVNKMKSGENIPRPSIVITIDDGFKDNYDVLFPLVVQEKIPVAIFLTTGYIDTDHGPWFYALEEFLLRTPLTSFCFQGQEYDIGSFSKKRDAFQRILIKIKDMSPEGKGQSMNQLRETFRDVPLTGRAMLTWDECREMLKSGLVTFGAHTCSHSILSKLPLAEARKEIADSKNIIEKNLSVKCEHFAFPNGRRQDFNQELLEFCREIGFVSICTCEYGSNKNHQDIFNLKRVWPSTPLSVFACNMIRALK